MNGVLARGEAIAAAAVDRRLKRITAALRQAQDERNSVTFSRAGDEVRVSTFDLSKQLATDGSLREALGVF